MHSMGIEPMIFVLLAPFSPKMTNLCVCLQADQLMFALHFVKGMNPELFQENVSVCVWALNSHNQSWMNDDVSISGRLQLPQWLWQDKCAVISPASKAQ